MRANLFLHSDSLKYNGTDTEKEFFDKFVPLLDDLIEIRNEYGEDNTILVSTELSDGDVALFRDKNIYEIAVTLDSEEKNFIFSLMGNSAVACDVTLEDFEKKCMYDENETECNTVIFLNKPMPVNQTIPIEYMTFDHYQIVYGTESWHTFRRQIMGNHPGSPKEFMNECKVHFPNIVFHPNCETSISGYLDLIPRKIVYYLSCMNDKLLDHIKVTSITDENALLADFCGKYGFEDAGTRQSTPGKKKSYQYKFIKQSCADCPENYKTITCDPHMKITTCDKNKRTPSHFAGRIYFHYGDDEIAKGKLLVGSIGPHVA